VNPQSARYNAVVAVVEATLAAAAYVFLKPLIGYWCFVAVAPLVYLATIATFVACIILVGEPASADVPPSEAEQPEDE